MATVPGDAPVSGIATVTSLVSLLVPTTGSVITSAMWIFHALGAYGSTPQMLPSTSSLVVPVPPPRSTEHEVRWN